MSLRIALLTALAGNLAVGAEPERFHLEGTARQIDTVTTKLSLAGGRERQFGAEPRFGAYRTAGETVTTVNETRIAGTIRCTAWDAQGEDINLQGICEVAEGPDRWSMTYSCNMKGAPEPEGWCWGQTVGMAGRYDGRRGSFTWRAAGGRLVGEGVWRN